MKKSFSVFRFFGSSVLLVVLLGGIFMFSGCNKQNDDHKTTDDPTATTEIKDVVPTAEPLSEVELSGEWGKSITNAYNVKNKIDTYYNNTDRTSYHFGNTIFEADYSLDSSEENVISDISTTDGKVYLDRALETYYKDSDGNTFYSADSTEDGRINLLRYGYYYYDLRVLGLNFGETQNITNEIPFDITQKVYWQNQVADFTSENGKVSFTIDGSDSYFCFLQNICSTSDINAVEITVKADNCSSGSVYFVAGSYSDFNASQVVTYSLKSNENENTYLISFKGATDFTGTLKGIRFGFYGEKGSSVEISNVRFVNAESVGEDVVYDHQFHLYGDKVNSIERIVAKEETTNVRYLGTNTYIDENRVSKIIIKDKNGLQDSLDNVDWESAEYAGFDIKDVGVFGYILLADDSYGSLKITIKDGFYIINQEKEITKKIKSTGSEKIGQRLYFDVSHSFDDFVNEAEIERNPLDIDTKGFKKYDVERGAYTYSVNTGNWNDCFFKMWNKHYSVNATIKNTGDSERKIYILASTTFGGLEGACVLDSDEMMLPISLEVCKNFCGENEEPIYDAGDTAYGEAIFPVVLGKDQEISMKILHLYQNWGNFPLKQLSSIQYYVPYYHLSTGVTETSCIAPWFTSNTNLWTLPDFRPMSAPYWYEMEGEYYSNQPQHTHGGYQYFLRYTDSTGIYNGTENIDNNIISSGPSYAQVKMTYLSDDKKILATYTHSEMPQTDEHRVYYEMKFEVLDDVSIDDFKNDFSFYSAYAYSGNYQTIGYLDENNNFANRSTVSGETAEFITLGDDCPYFALYNYEEISHNGFIDNGNNTNLGCSIYNYDITIGGKKYTGNLVLALAESGARLTLDLSNVTLKKGDTIFINMIISPWGDQNSEDDSNVRNIRENSCKNVLTLTSIDGEKLDSVFVPSIKSTNGTSCEFTLSGGANNATVRAYGFKSLSVPKVYELIDGEYVEIEISSKNNGDKKKNAHSYDGYTVFYDGDGTYSYAFVSERTGDRTFKIVVSDDD